MNLTTRLRERPDPIRVGVVGAGIFGSQLVHAVESTTGMETSVLADVETEKASTTLRRAGVPEEDVAAPSDAAGVDAALAAGNRAVVADGTTLVDADVDVVVEATGNPVAGARHCYRALLAGTDVVNATVETDAVCGPLLADLADRNGATYSLAYGDQPALMVDLYEWAGAAGFEVIAVGKSGSEPERYGTPEDAVERYDIPSFGEGIDPDPRMYNTFTDGTKAAVETVAAANALDFAVDEGGVNKPTAALPDLPATFRRASEGGVLARTPVVDAVTPTDGEFSVFVVTRTTSGQLRDYYRQRRNVVTTDDGAYQAFVRPHHFAPETTVSVASVALDGEPTGAPRAHRAEVVAAAKRDLAPGDEIDGPGGYTIYGVAVDADVAAAEGYVPFELLAGAEVTRPLERDEYVTADHVAVPETFLSHLRAVQDGVRGD
ncbi:MAG: SAF domain-containing protein [Haloferacaceae archaeon]